MSNDVQIWGWQTREYKCQAKSHCEGTIVRYLAKSIIKKKMQKIEWIIVVVVLSNLDWNFY